MTDDYLWDRTGPPDPEIARLEELLEMFKHAGPLPEPRTVPRRRRPMRRILLAVAAAIVIGVVSLPLIHRGRWNVEVLSGTAFVNGRETRDRTTLTVGSEIRTGPGARVRIEAGALGTVSVAETSKVTVEKTALRESRLSLDYGRIDAILRSPPRVFLVRTPIGEAIDLGCVYALEVTEGGSRGRLSVSAGWVALDTGVSTVFIPAGAASSIVGRDLVVPPIYDDAPSGFRDAVEAFVRGTPGNRTGQLDSIVREGRRRDALTLWHLLADSTSTERRELLRAIALTISIDGIDTERIADGDSTEIRRLGRRLGLKESRWWLSWAARGLKRVLGTSGPRDHESSRARALGLSRPRRVKESA